MNHRLFVAFLCLLISGCSSTGSVQQTASAPAQTPAPKAEPQTVQAAQTERTPALDIALISSQSERVIAPFTHGSNDYQISDFMPILSDSSGYSQKWEFVLYTQPYETRIKFEISNFAFSKNEGKVRGYIMNTENTDEEYALSETLKSGQWKAGTDSFALDFGDYHLSYADGSFRITGSFEKGSFEYDVPAHFWKPDTGSVYFGNQPGSVFKYSLLTYHQNVSRGMVHIDGQDIPVSGQAYGNHYAITQAVYEVFTEVADFRRRTDDLLVEFRYYVPTSKFDTPPFGFMFAAFDGTPVIESTDISRIPLEKWLDDQHYGYEIDARQNISAKDGENSALLEMQNASPVAKDPYADLPTFQRNIATRFAKPIEYKIGVDWLLHLNVDGYQAKIPFTANYSMTRFQ